MAMASLEQERNAGLSDIPRLLEQIRALRGQLEKIFLQSQDLRDPQLLRVSCALDALIVQYLAWERDQRPAVVAQRAAAPVDSALQAE